MKILGSSLEAAATESFCRLDEGPAIEDSSPENQLVRQEEAMQLLEAMSKLKPREREALILQKYHGWTLAQIAEHLGCTTGAVAGYHAALAAGIDETVVVPKSFAPIVNGVCILSFPRITPPTGSPRAIAPVCPPPSIGLVSSVTGRVLLPPPGIGRPERVRRGAKRNPRVALLSSGVLLVSIRKGVRPLAQTSILALAD